MSKVIQKMNNACKQVVNETYERYKLNTREQRDSEDFDSFHHDLIKLSLECNYGNLRDSLIKDRIVVGVEDANLRKKLLQNEDLKMVRTNKSVQ